MIAIIVGFQDDKNENETYVSRVHFVILGKMRLKGSIPLSWTFEAMNLMDSIP